MIEFQAKVSTIETALLANLKGAPFCLPPPSYGVQLQGVRFQSVKIAHDAHRAYPKTVSYRRYLTLKDPDNLSVDALQTQIVITGTIELVRVQTIQTHPINRARFE